MKKLLTLCFAVLCSLGLWADDCTTLVSFATSQHQTSNPRKVYGYTTTEMTEASRIELTCDNSNTKGVNSGAQIRLDYGNKYLQIPEQESVTSVNVDYNFYNSGTTQRTCSLKVAVGSTEKIVEISGLNSDGYKTAEFTFTPAATGVIKITNMGSGNSNLNLYLDNITYCTASGGDDPEPGVDETAPTLASSTPANGAAGVALSGSIALTFSEAIASVDATKFTLTGATLGNIAIDNSDAKKVNVAYSNAANAATVTLAVAADAVADAAGNKSAALANISFVTIATVVNLETISSNRNVYFEDLVNTNVASGALLDNGYVLSYNGNSYSNGKGTDGTISKLYCIRVKSATQDVLAFKVGNPCTLVVYGDRIKDRVPFVNDKVAAKTDGDNSIDGVITVVSGNTGYATYDIPAAGTYYIIGSGSDCYLAGLQFSDFCESPANALTLSSDAVGTVYVGDEITFATDGGNGGTVTIAGAAEETITDGKWTATLGEHTFVATQAKNGNYCAQESEALVLNVIQKTPVTAVSVAGETSTYVGDVLTYTATAANATAYEWYINEEKQGSDSAKLIVTAAVKGAYSIVCKARNEFNAENEWIASEAVNLTVAKGSGVLISYIVNGDANGATSKSGIFSENATPKVSLTKGTSSKLTIDEIEYTGFKMDKGKYVGVTLSKGSFIIGDTVSFMITSATGSAKLYLYNDEQGTTRLDSIEGIGVTGWATFILNQPTKGVYLYRSNPDIKPYDQNPLVAAMKVIRPKDVKSVAEALTAVSVNANAISAAQMTSLLADESLAIEDDYLNAPTIVFTKTITTTYDDDSQSAKNVEIEVEAEEVTGKWQAQAEINDVTYTVTTAKTASYTVTYKCGEETLGTELVITNGHPTDYAKYQTLALSTFNGWYSDATLETAVEDMSAEVISSATTYYADITYKYATSVNIEQIVLDNNKKYDVIAQMGGLGYESNIDNSLDSLDNSKTKRNYPYLGLKIKAGGKLLNFRIAKGSTVKVKFGNVGATPLVSLNGSEYAAMELSEGVYTHTATAETLISIKTASDATLVFKQIMFDEDLKEVVLPALYTVTYNAGDGTCAVEKAETQFAGDKVVLPAATPAENYEFDGWYDAETDGTKVGVAGAEYAPTANITLFAYYTPAGGGSAINNTDAAVKTVKVIRNGQLIIIRDGKEFNVLGTAVK